MENKPNNIKPVEKKQIVKVNKSTAKKPVPSPQTVRKSSSAQAQKQGGQRSRQTEKKRSDKKANSPVPTKKQEIYRKPAQKPTQRTISQVNIDEQTEEILNKPHKKIASKNREYSKPLAPAKEPISPYKRKFKRALFYIVTLVILIGICAVLSLTVFFKIDNIEVEGKTRYNSEDIIASSFINKGDNLILCNTSEGEKQIEKDFPYIEEVNIQKKLFNKIIINVTEAKPASIIESNGQYVVLSKSGKIIEIDKEKKYNIPTILGAKLEDIKLSSDIKFKDKNVSKHIEEIISAVNSNSIKNIEMIDISNLSKVTLISKSGFKIIIGTPENVEYKLKTAKAIMSKKIENTDKGTLDVSLASADGGKSYFSPDKSESSVQSSVENSNESSTENSNENQDESL